MHEWRVTKYDPARRDAEGAYRADTWTSVTDIGRVFEEDGELTLERYLDMEDRYVAAALGLFRATGLARLVVEGLELAPDVVPAPGLAAPLEDGPPLREGMRLDEDGIARVCRINLRELAWCRLESPGRFFIHFGYDFYMYVGSRADLPDAVDHAAALGLHVERHPSPYLQRAWD
jgi:hypothetical protein